MISTRALSGPRGIVGFVPRDAFDAGTNGIIIEVDVEFDDSPSIKVSLRTNVLELQEKLRHSTTDEFRDWLRERARTKAALAEPLHTVRTTASERISWLCHAPVRREPFLRY